MKVLKRTESDLVIGERGLGTRHWGLFMFILAGGGYTALYIDGDVMPVPMHLIMIGIASVGLLVAIFMGKRLTHRLNKTTGVLRVEYPARIDSKLIIEEYRISDIKSIKSTELGFWQRAMTNTSDRGSALSQASSGFSYVMNDGKEVESGIFTSETKKMLKVMEALKEFLQVPIE